MCIRDRNMLLTNCWSDMGQIYEKNILPITWPKLMKAEVGEFVQTTPKLSLIRI